MSGRLHDLSVPRGVTPNPELSPRGAANIDILLDLLDRAERVAGDIAECGVYRGNTLVTMALYLRRNGSHKKLFGFDSFHGFPSDELSTELSLCTGGDPNKTETGFTDTSYDLVRQKLDLFQLGNVELARGYFNDTLPRYSKETFSFVHLDCDLYGSYKDCLQFFYPRLAQDGIILLDEYNDPPWPGCNKAVDEFLSGKQEVLQEIARQNYQKYYFVKSGETPQVIDVKSRTAAGSG
jgi:O-methyltransferase